VASLGEILTRLAFQPRHIRAHLFVVAIHPIEPVTQPSDSRLEETDRQFWKSGKHSTANDIHARRLLLERMTNHMEEERIVVTIATHGRHARAETAVNRDGDV